MSKVFLLDTFCINRLNVQPGECAKVHVCRVDVQYAAHVLEKVRIENSIGHPPTAAMVAKELAEFGIELHPAERRTMTLGIGQEAVVAQYVRLRLPDGTVKFPEEAKINWHYVVRTA